LNLVEKDFDTLAKHGAHYSVSPLGEAGRPGEMQFAELMQKGVLVSLSIDNVTAERCDCFACMRMMQTVNKHRSGGKFKLPTKRLVEIATIEGARDLGFDAVTGSLTPGKRADLILIRTEAPNIAPIGDPYDALVQLAQPANVDTVVVDGRILRRNGQFTALDHDKVTREAADAVASLKARALAEATMQLPASTGCEATE